MNLVISESTETPIYRQIFEQISGQIVLGQLAKDDCLPPIRTVAKELRISVITIKRAWEELENSGFIYTVAGKGCFVSPISRNDLTNIRDDLVTEKIKKDLAFYQSLGLSLEELLDLIRKNFASNSK